ncbi:NACHT domain-containing protein [Glycomyces sp. A-F 0318]|uniref:NACHT domain-containing protein n=1 Tax=Glycomyces amatae TaxID=2881355 RepID=UPI001E6410B3|nr:NACHT domain-containing protein [Glycomyces amatae]MCD0445381.1 NACHT domain-containing protein [Glycomyces amatae]
MPEPAATLFLSIEKRSPAGGSAGRRSARDSSAALEFELRFLTLLALAGTQAAGLSAPRISRSPGLGELISLLRVTRDQLQEASGTAATQIWTAVTEVLELFDRGIPNDPNGLRSFRNLRNHISHGGPLISELSPETERMVRATSEAILSCLDGALLVVRETMKGTRYPSITWAEEEIPLWPFICARGDGNWLVYATFNSSVPKYHCFGPGGVVSKPEDIDGETIRALGSLVRERKDKKSTALSEFIADVKRDLEGFTEDQAEVPEYFEHEDGFGYQWVRATSGGNEPRVDLFRIGSDNQRQWRGESAWLRYSKYLRTMANWQVIAARIRRDLESAEQLLADEEQSFLDWDVKTSADREARVVVSDYDGRNKKEQTFSVLIDGIDEDLEVEKGQTQVVFVNGEAGIGKTRALINAAKRRALQVESAATAEDEDLPLFLYMRSTGNAFASLTTAVRSAVSVTRNLTQTTVEVLCRNGQMALLIDGFDELLGSPAYNDALGSLRPWLETLSGRGVLVVSARSSYYLNQYRSSVERASMLGHAAVRHRIAEVQRWSETEIRSFLADYQVPVHLVERLTASDRELLGLPFFARGFAEMYRKGADDLNAGVSLPTYLLRQYITREQGKLRRGETVEAGSLISHEELMRTFAIVADLMSGNDDREADLDTLEYAAAEAIGVPADSDLDQARPMLKKRLPVLCGLDLQSFDGGEKRFRFQHELFYDQFLAEAAATNLNEADLPQFYSMLRSSLWRRATVAGVVAACGTDLVIEAVESFNPSQRKPLNKAETPIVRANIGSLWSEVIKQTGHFPTYPVKDADFAGTLDLSGVECSHAQLLNCSIDSLVIPESPNWRVSLQGTIVNQLVSGNPHPSLSGLTGLAHADLSVLLIRTNRMNEYWERRSEIFDALRRHGASVVDAPDETTSQISPKVEHARHFLSGLMFKAESSVVLKSNYELEDDRLHNLVDNQSEWRDFAKLLEETELATTESFSASGKRKIRMRFKVGIKAVLNNDGTNDKVTKFWDRLR